MLDVFDLVLLVDKNEPEVLVSCIEDAVATTRQKLQRRVRAPYVSIYLHIKVFGWGCEWAKLTARYYCSIILCVLGFLQSGCFF